MPWGGCCDVLVEESKCVCVCVYVCTCTRVCTCVFKVVSKATGAGLLWKAVGRRQGCGPETWTRGHDLGSDGLTTWLERCPASAGPAALGELGYGAVECLQGVGQHPFQSCLSPDSQNVTLFGNRASAGAVQVKLK